MTNASQRLESSSRLTSEGSSPDLAEKKRVVEVAPVAGRDVRIDFLRGLFILSLVGSHFSWFAHVAGYTSALRFYDFQPLGFSSPAEFFMFFSGYVLALAVGKTFDKVGWFLSTARCVHRSWQLYLFNAFALIFVIAASDELFQLAPALADVSGVSALRAHGFAKIGDYLRFRNEPAFFEILRDYVFFVPLVPTALWLMRWPSAYFAIIISVWAASAARVGPVPTYRSFNPLAWQLIFFVGCYVGAKRPFTTWRLDRRPLNLALFLGLIAGMFCLKMFFRVRWGADVPGISKTDLGPLRLLHFAVLLWGALLLVPASDALRRSRLAAGITGVGRNSLECFCLSNVLVYFGVEALTRAGLTVPGYFLALLALFTVVVGAARLFTWFKSEPWSKPSNPRRSELAGLASHPKATTASAVP